MSALRSFFDPVRRMYRRLSSRSEDTPVRAIAEALAAAPVFQSLDDDALFDLATSVHARTYRREEFLYYEGDPGLGLYVVRRGRVRLMAEDESGTLHELRQAGPGEVFGELSVLGDFSRMETAQATAETHVLGFFRPNLKTMRRRHPQAAASVVEALARHLGRRQVDVVHRVAERDGRIAARRMLEGTASAPPAPPSSPHHARPSAQ